MVAVTRRLARNRDTRLLNLPDALISRVLELATDDDEPWESRWAPLQGPLGWRRAPAGAPRTPDRPPAPRCRCRLALVCKAFRDLWCCQAFAGRTLCLDFQAIRWRIVMSTGQRAARRRQLCAALARVAPSVRALTLRNQLCAREAGLALGPLLAPLAPHVQTLVAHDGLSAELLKALGGGAWAALRELAFLGCNPWADLEPGELAALQRQLAALPGVCAKVAKFECCEWGARLVPGGLLCEGLPAARRSAPRAHALLPRSAPPAPRSLPGHAGGRRGLLPAPARPAVPRAG